MGSKDIKDFAIVAVVAYGLSVVLKLFGDDDEDKAAAASALPAGYQPNVNAIITITQANNIAFEIKKHFSYTSYPNIVAIDQALWKLQNKYDVEVVHAAFGEFDGPFLYNGNLLEVLQKAINAYPYDYEVNKESIKAHLYEYGVHIKY